MFDLYKELSYNALDRFLMFLTDSLSILENTHNNPDMQPVADFSIYYLKLCYRQKRFKDKSLNRKLVKALCNVIANSIDHLSSTYDYIIDVCCNLKDKNGNYFILN